jgi:hypothetical protein
MLLQAGTSKDAILVPAAAGTYPLFDRFLNLTNNQATGGGSYAFLSVGVAPPAAPIPAPAGALLPAVTQATTSPGRSVTIQVATSRRFDPRSVHILGRPSRGGRVINHHDGTVTYQPPLTRVSTDWFSYTVRPRYSSKVVVGKVKVTIRRSLPRPVEKARRG